MYSTLFLFLFLLCSSPVHYCVAHKTDVIKTQQQSNEQILDEALIDEMFEAELVTKQVEPPSRIVVLIQSWGWKLLTVYWELKNYFFKTAKWTRQQLSNMVCYAYYTKKS